MIRATVLLAGVVCADFWATAPVCVGRFGPHEAMAEKALADLKALEESRQAE